MTMISEELLPCPFCGGDARLGISGDYGDGDPQVHCDNLQCRISGPYCDTEAEAIAAWNLRTSPPPSGEAGEDEGCGHCAKCGLDWDAPASAPRCDECPPAAVEPRKRAEALTEEILKIMRGARAYLPVYSKEAIVELLVGALPTIKEPTDGK